MRSGSGINERSSSSPEERITGRSGVSARTAARSSNPDTSSRLKSSNMSLISASLSRRVHALQNSGGHFTNHFLVINHQYGHLTLPVSCFRVGCRGDYADTEAGYRRRKYSRKPVRTYKWSVYVVTSIKSQLLLFRKIKTNLFDRSPISLLTGGICALYLVRSIFTLRGKLYL